MAVAKVEEAPDDVLSSGFLERMRAGAGHALKRALSKVVGLFHASAGLVFLDQSLLAVKKQFVRLHEAAHGFLPWQRPMYAVVEDGENSLHPDAADEFDREANVFAAEVLFQLDTFRACADAEEFGIFTPIRLAKTFGASLYSAIRQYVSKNRRVCAVLVLNMPELIPGDGFRATLRRPIQSDAFTSVFGKYAWKECYTPDDELGALVPLGSRRASGKRSLSLTDKNGTRHECIGESFTQKHQVFILIHSVGTLTTTRVVLASTF